MIKLMFKVFALLAGFTLLSTKRDQWPAGATDETKLLGLDDTNQPANRPARGDNGFPAADVREYHDTGSYPIRPAMPYATDPALKPKRFSYRATIESGDESYDVHVAGSQEFIRMVSHSFMSSAFESEAHR